MIEQGFVEALNNSIDHFNAGDSIADYLRSYPQYAAELSPLLEAGNLVRRAQADTNEADLARERQRARFERALTQPYLRSPRRSFSPKLLVGLAASLILILTLFTGGLGVLAERSLPGDPLYHLKLWTETIRLTVTNNDPNLQAAFAERRIEEARQLVQLRRQAEMTLTGTVEATVAGGMFVEGLPITGEAARIAVGSRVEVNLMSTTDGKLIALHVRLLETPPDLLPPPGTPEPTSPPSLTQRAASTTTPSPTSTYLETSAPTREPTAARPRTNEPTLLDRRPDTRSDCQALPTGWVRYRIQPGDTLSGLAVESGSTVDAIVAANCLEGARYIIAGQMIFLPRPPVQTPTQSPEIITRPASDTPPTQIDRPASDLQNPRGG